MWCSKTLTKLLYSNKLANSTGALMVKNFVQIYGKLRFSPTNFSYIVCYWSIPPGTNYMFEHIFLICNGMTKDLTIK